MTSAKITVFPPAWLVWTRPIAGKPYASIVYDLAMTGKELTHIGEPIPLETGNETYLTIADLAALHPPKETAK